jgi:crotonobetainyl-CoA:carnitine CoA-transferase CaiB-like acyl-CoA transferase
VLSARNPGVILMRQPGFGADGPEASYRAFGNTIEGMSGLTSLVGYAGGAPTMMSNAMGDPVSGLNATVALQAALRARGRDGRGRCVEVAQLDGFLPLMSEELIAYQRTGQLPERRGNERPTSMFAAVVPAAGDDVWIAVECVTQPQYEAMRKVTGGQLEVWAAAQSVEDAVEALIAAGVPAAKVNAEPDLVGSGMLAGAGFWELIDREFVGAHLYPGVPIVADGARWESGVPAPTLGQHDAEVAASPWGRERTTVE